MSEKVSVRSFTTKAPYILKEILTSIGISKSIITGKYSEKPKRLETQALWDTGATNCAITKKAADLMKLLPTSMAMVAHAGGISYKNVYLVDLHLPNHVTLENMKLTECDYTGDLFDVIIGMDVISLGDFVITNHNNSTTISFRIPSVNEIDFEQEQYNNPL